MRLHFLVSSRFRHGLWRVIMLLLVVSSVFGSEHLVKTLPGLPGDLPFTLKTGYTGVGESDTNQFFYYFIESERNPKDDPLVLWLTGGPGCSVLSGLSYEIGPFMFDYAKSTLEEPVLELNPYAWTKVANIIFLDQPVGTGFSYAKTQQTYMMSDTISAAQTYAFLRKWLVEHPDFLENPLYVGADSYCGIILPIIVQKIYDGNEGGYEPLINVKGYLLGNPLTDTNNDYNSKIPFAHDMTLLSDAQYQSVKATCRGEYLEVDLNNTACVNDLEVVQKCLEKISEDNILEPWCDIQQTSKEKILSWDVWALEDNFVDLRLSPLHWRPRCRDDYFVYSNIWANKRDVQEALHIHKGTNNYKWTRCNHNMKFKYGIKSSKSYLFDVPSSLAYHQYLSGKRCRALVYSGDHDMVVPHVGTQKWIKSLGLPIEKDWSPWFVEEQVAGYTMKYSNGDYKLTFASVKAGGHLPPQNKPKQSFAMFRRWLADRPL